MEHDQGTTEEQIEELREASQSYSLGLTAQLDKLENEVLFYLQQLKEVCELIEQTLPELQPYLRAKLELKVTEIKSGFEVRK